MSNEDDKAFRPTRASREVPSAAPTPMHNVRDLLGSAREAILVHGHDRYRLRITASNKLIMTK